MGESQAIQRICRNVDILAQNDNVDLLICGETGTGKGVVVNAIHDSSPRRDTPLVKINCGAIPETLLESELFGYEKGAFTGANKAKKGLMELADGGTVFLDEIGELPLSMQAKLLTFLEDRRFKRVGGLRDIEVNVRIIAATNRDLEEEVEKGTFPGRPVLPPERDADPYSPSARAARGYSGVGPVLPGALQPEIQQAP